MTLITANAQYLTLTKVIVTKPLYLNRLAHPSQVKPPIWRGSAGTLGTQDSFRASRCSSKSAGWWTLSLYCRASRCPGRCSKQFPFLRSEKKTMFVLFWFFFQQFLLQLKDLKKAHASEGCYVERDDNCIIFKNILKITPSWQFITFLGRSLQNNKQWH